MRKKTQKKYESVIVLRDSALQGGLSMDEVKYHVMTAADISKTTYYKILNYNLESKRGWQ